MCRIPALNGSAKEHMKTKYFTSPLVIMVLVVSCKTETRYPKEIARLDSLYKAIESAEAEYLKGDTTGITAMGENISKNIGFVQENYKDTMDFKTALLVSNYHGILKPINQFGEKKKEIEEESVYAKKQIKGLSHDLANNLLANDSAEAYMESEEEAVIELIKSLDIMKTGLKHIREKYQTLNPGIDSLVNILKQSPTKPEKAG